MLREAVNPFHPRCVRASGGAVFGATLLRGPSIDELARLREEKGFELVALDRGGAPIAAYRFPKGFALLAGVEGPGLPDALRANAVSIPMEGGVESLNAAVAASIALYAWRSLAGPSGRRS
jgi:tRNA G18 (ribose-2'-O)-methylase SpoU